MAERHLAERLAAYATGLRYSDIDERTIHAATVRVLDSIACGVASRQEEPIRTLLAYASDKRGRNDARILGTNRPVALEYASFATAAAIRYLDWNDVYDSWNERYATHSVSHPSGNIGGLLCAADAFDWTGRDLLRGVVLAYEIQCRLTDATVPKENGFDHVIFGLVSTALAVGSVIGSSEAELTEAVNIALAGHLPLRQARVGELTEWKGLAFGNACRNAIVAVELARAGIRGPSRIFEGKYGLSSRLEHPIEVDIERFGGVGGEFRIGRTHLKPYPICYHITGAVDCLAAIDAKHPVDWDRVRSIDVSTYDRAIGVTADSDEKWDPRSRNTADHSLPYCLARWIVDRELDKGQFTDEKIHDPEIRPLMAKVGVARLEDDGGESRNGTRSRSNQRQTVVVDVDGTEYVEGVDYPRGHANDPLSEDEVEAKARSGLGTALQPTKIDAIVDWCRTLESHGDVDEIFRLTAAESTAGT